MEQRKLLEKEFHNKIRFVTDDNHVTDTRWSSELENTIKSNELWSNMKYYAIERKSRNMVLEWFKANCLNKKVLDYCCGNGEDGIFIAEHGAKEVIGIDISDISIENSQSLAKKKSVENRTRYIIDDAENTKFPDNSFDIITEYGALHHLDLEKAFKELARLIKVDGKIICNEALAHNIIIHAYRKLTPHLRTGWEVEHIMKNKDIYKAKKYFNNIEVHLFHLTTLFAVPFRNTRIFIPLLKFLEKLDDFLLKIPILKWQAWQAVFVLSEPKKQ